MTNWCFTNDPSIFIVTVALAICSVNTNIKCNKYELACLEAIHVFSHIYGDRQEQNIITKVKTESQNPKTKSQNPKQNHKTQNRITKPKTESQNPKQKHKTQIRNTKLKTETQNQKRKYKIDNREKKTVTQNLSLIHI